jgi:hypothetical protein
MRAIRPLGLRRKSLRCFPVSALDMKTKGAIIRVRHGGPVHRCC